MNEFQGSAERLAQRFHEAYERLAPSHGYETRKASAKPWADVPEPNRSLMIEVAAELLATWPAAEAGRADGDVYLAVALGVDPVDPYEMAGNPSFRAAIDAARAPLLADIDQLKHGMAAWVRTRLDDALGQRDRALAELAEYERNVEELNTKTIREIKRIGRERDEWKKKAHAAWEQGDRDAAQRIELIRQREEALAEVKRITDASWTFVGEMAEAARVERDRLKAKLAEVRRVLSDE